MKLDKALINKVKAGIENAIAPAMEKIYGNGDGPFSEEFRPGLKTIEKIVAYYDYWACGISVLAIPAASGDTRALKLIEKIKRNIADYRADIFGHDAGEIRNWRVPLRRLLLHIALFYERLSPFMAASEKRWWRSLVGEQVPLALEHCANFLPGEKNLHCAFVNNHTAIFMQGIYHCGRVFGRPDWVETAREFAERFFESGHPDGYFEENTNMKREGGPSLVYTRLTAGCLYDVLDGKSRAQDKFVKAGRLYRSLLNHAFEHIPIADERTNFAGTGANYGLALHSLTPQGRHYIAGMLKSLDYGKASPEALAVIHHELNLMREGDCELPENRVDGAFRISLPLGVLRKNGFTAGLSALRALNREIGGQSDYALDQQNMAYLSHKKCGVILSGFKSKNDPDYSTFRIAGDAWPVKTGLLEMGTNWIEARIFYRTFTARARWEIGKTASLSLGADAAGHVTTVLPIADERLARADCACETIILTGFSPYSAGNKTEPVKALKLAWKKNAKIVFSTGH